jgi:hypothetical protein
MRSAHVFSCYCGAQYKAVTDFDKDSTTQGIPFTCPVCNDMVRIDGNTLSVLLEVSPLVWLTVEVFEGS